MLINHANINWNIVEYEIFKNAKTLILGSFNPNQPNQNDNTDYYYGRNSNYFWKVLGAIIHENESHYHNNIEHKITAMLEYKFCFSDIVESIEVECLNNPALEHLFVDTKIFKNFSDSILFTSNPNFNNNIINIVRNYNINIPDLINQYPNISRIIHTLGNSRISQDFITNPIENNIVGNLGFQAVINQIVNLDIDFNPISFSPSQIAVNRGGQVYRNNLAGWLQYNIGF